MPANRIFISIAVLIVSWFSVPVLHYIHGNEFIWAKAKNVAVVARMMESGVLLKYLDDRCPTNPTLSLCNHKDKMHGHAFEFLWSPDSPVLDGDCAKNNWVDCWIQKDKEYTPVVRDILTTPRYLFPFAYQSLINSMDQLCTFGILDIIPMNEGSPVQWLIRDHYRNELNQYVKTEQSKHTVTFAGKNRVQMLTVILSLAVIIFVLLKKSFRKILSPRLAGAIIFLTVGIILNAVICATFSGLVDRYQGRIVWLIPLTAIALLGYLSSRKNKFTDYTPQS